MKTVIFDVDGVLLSEERYFDVTALTIWEWLYSPSYMGLDGAAVHFDVSDGEITALRHQLFGADAVLSWLKGHGVNSNWDMVHAYLAVTLLLLARDCRRQRGKSDFVPPLTQEAATILGRNWRGLSVPPAAEILAALAAAVPADADKDGVFAALTAQAVDELGASAASWLPLRSPFWQLHVNVFQHWYFGDDLYAETYGGQPLQSGKDGFLTRERPLAPATAIREMFVTLKERGYTLAVATGRSTAETMIPFRTYHWLEAFDKSHMATASDVAAASKQLGRSLDKPHPFAYYLGAFGNVPERYGDYVEMPERFLNGTYYVVGDSLADVLGARSMGAVMIATLTGLEGEAARPMFEREGADFIVAKVTDILAILT